MKRIATFTGYTTGQGRVDRKINDWLDDNPDVDILDVRTTMGSQRLDVIVVTLLCDVPEKDSRVKTEHNPSGEETTE